MRLKPVMVPLFLLFLVIFCKQPAKTSQHNSIINEPDTITVAFYNLDNLFDAIYDGSEYAEYNPAISNWSQEMFLKKISNTADVITAINAEIIGLCEVENALALKSLQRELIKRGLHYKYSAIGDFPLKANTCVALLSKLPIKDINSIEVRLDDGHITRNILEADIEFHNEFVKIFVNHWPSMGHPEKTRITAATVLAKRLSELSSGTDYILIGDFNSNYNECEKKDKHHRQISQITGINSYLKTIRSRSSITPQFTTEHDMIDGAAGHYDLWFEIPLHSRMSEVFNGYNQTLDHILLPSSLFDKSGVSYVDNSFNTFTWNGKLLQGNVPYRWQCLHKGTKKSHKGEGYSDHLPLIARFHYGPYDDVIENQESRTTAKGITEKTTKRPSTFTVPQKWTLCNNSAVLTTTADNGQNQHLHIKCSPSPSNISIARKSMTMTHDSLIYKLKGAGKISIRVRSGDSGWIYFNAPEYKGTKSARYNEVHYIDWTKIRLDLHTLGSPNKVEIEIRSGKNSQFDFEIDETAL